MINQSIVPIACRDSTQVSIAALYTKYVNTDNFIQRDVQMQSTKAFTDRSAHTHTESNSTAEEKMRSY